MPKVATKLPRKKRDKYQILIGKNIIQDLPKHLDKLALGKKYAIITDSVVKKLFAVQMARNLREHGIESEIFTFEKGELSKRLSTVEVIAEKMVKKGFDRHDAVICLGGGVVGDLGGFLASIYMRGIPYIQIPTTLLAMVDSAVGGKNGVDMECGKNLLGTIIQPKAVFIDLDYLLKLPEKQIRNGLAEVIKYGVIRDKKLFKFIEQNLDKIFAHDEKALTYITKKSIQIKTKVVEKDESEHTNLRIILNYGHTYGHAIEKKSGYKLLHGYAISIGMVIANQIAVRKKIMKKQDADRIRNLLKKAGLPVVAVNKPTIKDIASDKKKIGDCVMMVVPTKIGKVTTYMQKCQ